MTFSSLDWQKHATPWRAEIAIHTKPCDTAKPRIQCSNAEAGPYRNDRQGDGSVGLLIRVEHRHDPIVSGNPLAIMSEVVRCASGWNRADRGSDRGSSIEHSLSSALALRLDEANDEIDLILHRHECRGQVNPKMCSDPRRIAVVFAFVC